MLHFHIMRIMKDIEKMKYDLPLKSETCKIEDRKFPNSGKKSLE